jgi:hypothetical protein
MEYEESEKENYNWIKNKLNSLGIPFEEEEDKTDDLNLIKIPEEFFNVVDPSK